MAYRDVLFAPLTSAFVLSGLPVEVVERLPDALVAVVRARRSARRRWPASALLERRLPAPVAAAFAARSVRSAPETASDPELIEAAQRHGFHGLPIALTTTSTRCVVLTAHAVYDGSGVLDLVHDLLDAAAGLPLAAEAPPVPLAVARALRQVRPRHVRAFVDARRNRPAGPPPLPATAPRSSAFALDGADMRAVRRYREPDRAGRPTLLSRLASLLVAALHEVATDGDDVPVWITSDVRHLAGGPVDGNFITRERFGRLGGDGWAPGALAARLVRLKDPGQALSLVWSPTGWLLRSALGRPPAAGEEVVLTLASTRRAFPVPVGAVTATSLGGSPVFGFAWQTADQVHVSAVSASPRFDLGRFEAVFRAEVRRRAGG